MANPANPPAPWSAYDTTPFVVMQLEPSWPYRDPATLLIKATFDLRPDEIAAIAESQDPATGDEVDPYDVTAAYRYDSDLAPHKPKVDLLLVGTGHAPGSEPVEALTVRWRVGSMERALHVSGDRRWELDDAERVVLGKPTPFRSMPLSYDRAFGGLGSESNPVGMGFGAREVLSDRSLLLPNVEDPDDRIRTPDDTPKPAGFGPLHRAWSDRTARLGTFDEQWLTERWPELPLDFDPGYHNAAPTAQQIDALAGDERLVLENLHAHHQRYESRLPGLRVRAFACVRDRESERFEEISLGLDTLWIDADAEKLVLSWRGPIDVAAGDDAARELLIVHEPIGAKPHDDDHYRALLEVERAKQAPVELPSEQAPEPANDNAPEGKGVETDLSPLLDGCRKALADAGAPPSLLAALATERDLDQFADKVIREYQLDEATLKQASEAKRAQLERALEEAGEDKSILDGFDEEPNEEPSEPPIDREWVTARAECGESLAGRDLSGLDLSGLDLSGADLRGAVLKATDLRDATLDGADLTEAVLAEATLSGASLKEAKVDGADLSDGNLDGADLTRASLEMVVARQVSAREALLTEALLSGGIWSDSDLSAASLAGAKAHRLLLDGCRLDGARLDGADLTEATLQRAAGAEVDLRGAKLHKLRAMAASLLGAKLDGCDASGAGLRDAKLTGASAAGADLRDADLAGVDLGGAVLTAANLRGSLLDRANLAGAGFAGADLFGARLLDADLSEADFRDASLFGAELLGSRRQGARFDGAALGSTKLAPDAPKLAEGR